MWQELLKNPWVFAAASGIGGAILTVLVQRILNKRGLFTYSVTHNQVGMSTEDSLFGSVKVTWNEKPIANLYLSTLELRNESLRDYENVALRVWTTTTSLLTERTDVLGTVSFLSWTPDFAKKVEVPHGQEATQAQLDLVYGRREYTIPTMNRGQVIRLAYLNAAKTAETPNIWIDVNHPGVRIEYRVLPQQFMGVPQPMAALLGTLLGVVVVPAIVAAFSSVWIIATLCFIYGVVVLLPGVALLKAVRWTRDAFAG